MKKLFICLSALGMILIGCSKNDDGESDKPNNNGNEQPENPNEPKLPELPALPDPDDVCSAMDDLNFMAYCYENFDVNKDGKVSVTEANAAKGIDTSSTECVSVKGVERFPNIKIFRSSNFITELDLRYNLKLQSFSCFSNKKLITVLLPNTLTSIGQSAFYNCSNLPEIHLPASLTSIGDSAFRYCDNLTEINFPDNLTSIGEYAFQQCFSLTEINLPASLTSIRGHAFSGCSSLTEIHLPASLTSIELYAFEYCSSLTKVTCHALVPPTLGVSSFDSKSIENLYVPAESIQAYKDSLWARYFKNILPIE